MDILCESAPPPSAEGEGILGFLSYTPLAEAGGAAAVSPPEDEDEHGDPHASEGETAAAPSASEGETAAALPIPESGMDGVTMAALRARVLGRASAPPAADHGDLYNELRARHQVDLNDEANVSVLEDPALIAHMEAARRRLAEHQKALLRLPRREALRTTYVESMGQLSALVRQLDDRHQAERENVETSHRQARVLGELAEGHKPHGYPAFGAAAVADPGAKEAMAVAAAKAAGVAEGYEALLETVGGVKASLFVLRRQVEAFGDGFLELLEASEEDRRRLREFLEIAARAKSVHAESAGPPGSLGELLIGSRENPEDSGISLGE